jgi:colanic acid biosynthesis glycosyl transferase WcaI
LVASVPEDGTAFKAIKKSGGGILVAPEDSQALATAILELYQKPEKVQELGDKSRQYAVDNYAFEQTLNQYETLFNSMTVNGKAVKSSIITKQEV